MTGPPIGGTTLPSVVAVDRIRAIDRTPLHNLHITQAYHAVLRDDPPDADDRP
jgi:hypothetical protein